MHDDQLLKRLSDHEDNFVERKPENVNSREIRRTLSAFANTLSPGNEAILFVGVGDDGSIIGVENTDSKQKNIRHICEQECYPPITSCVFRVLRLDEDRAVLAVIVSASPNRPHFTGPAFERRGSESVAASEKLFNELIASRNGKTERILAMRNGVITVRCIGRKLEDSRTLASSYCGTRECRIIDCDAHIVRLQDISSGTYATESLENVQISHDEERNRGMLIIRG